MALYVLLKFSQWEIPILKHRSYLSIRQRLTVIHLISSLFEYPLAFANLNTHIINFVLWKASVDTPLYAFLNNRFDTSWFNPIDECYHFFKAFIETGFLSLIIN